MQLRLIPDGAPDALVSLYDWLSHEDDLRGRVSLARPVPAPGEMGGIADAIVVALGSGGAIATLATALPIWLGKSRRATVQIEVAADEHGRKVVVRAENVKDVEVLLRQVLDQTTRHDRGPAATGTGRDPGHPDRHGGLQRFPIARPACGGEQPHRAAVRADRSRHRRPATGELHDD
ncbi:hypothetical protein [Amycolatopsis sp. FDAARGOS 1241]|uniref:effector-associated constant component EACC1 n=1 Tax=Amycolatopsis sp. FDAARGOS 1241 TaxID=2778070 RepID=UPI001950A070|nr:hypothetical protein [Amycolatopsis sp. FDAARGOS 1241]QRP49037.1 hypothetical protein I6J71_15290 [Amycolatopsis sp. FDAARGOS 1241]